RTPVSTATQTIPQAANARNRASGPSLQTSCLVAIAGLLVLGFFPLAARFFSACPERIANPRTRAPSVDSPWNRLPAYTGTFRPNFPGADAAVISSYASATHHVHVYVAHYFC